MTVISNEEWESNSFFFLRTLSFARIVLFGIAIVVQLVVLVECYLTIGSCDIFTVLVPPVMIFIDSAMIKRGRELLQWFYAVYLIVTVLSMFVGFIAMIRISFIVGYPGFPGFPSIQIITPSTIAEHIMRILSYGVIAISFIQMMALIHLTRPSQLKEEVDEEDLWLLSSNQDTLGEKEDEGVLQ